MKQFLKNIIILSSAILLFSCSDDFVNGRLDISGVAESAIIISPAWEADYYQFHCEGAGNAEYSIDSKPDWLSADDNSGRFTNDFATIHCKAKTETDFSKTGIYIDQMLISASGKKYAIPVYYINEGNPAVQVNSTFSIHYNNYNNHLEISNSGDGILLWDIVGMPEWLTVDMNQFNINSVMLGQGAAASIPFILDAEKAAQSNSLSGLITLQTNDKNTPYIEITVSADLGTPILSLFDNRLDFGSSETSKTFRISNYGDGLLIWNFEELPEWLSISPANGIQLPYSSYSDVVFTCDRTRLEPGLSSATIYLKSNDPNTPSYPVNVSVRMPGTPANIHPLEGNIFDVTFDKNTNTLYYVAGQPNKLVVYDLTGKTVLHEIALSKAPTSLSISEDFTKALVGHGGMISMVDLTNYSTTKTYELDLTVYDVEWANDGWFCYTQANSSNSGLFWINANNDETYETILSSRSLGTASLKKVPDQPYIIASRQNVSPSGIFVFDVDAKNLKSYSHETIGNVWFFDENKLIITGISDIIRTSSVTGITGSHLSSTSAIGQLKVADYPYITWWADWSEPAHSIWAIFSYYLHSYYPPVAATIYQFEDNDYTLTNTYHYDNLYQPDAQTTAYEVEAHYVFSNSSGTELSVLRKGKDNNNWSVEFIPVEL